MKNENTPNAPPGDAKPPEEKEPKVYRYRCVEKCTWGGQLRKVGDEITVNEKAGIPHFEPIA
jgi:hypothetical protein